MPYYPKQTNKTIPYNSPSGSINIGKWLPPFMPYEEGYGFIGVLAEDVGTGKLQCHICGEWFEMLCSHLAQKHKMSTDEYKAKTGLFQSTALKSKRIRIQQSELIQKMQKDGKMNVGLKGKNTSIKMLQKQAGNRKNKPKALEHLNKHGICELQVAEKIHNLAIRLGKTPSLGELIEEYGGGFATVIHSRYASYRKLVKDLGMEPVKNKKHLYCREYFVTKASEYIAKKGELKLKKAFTQKEHASLYRHFKGKKELEESICSKLGLKNG